MYATYEACYHMYVSFALVYRASNIQLPCHCLLASQRHENGISCLSLQDCRHHIAVAQVMAESADLCAHSLLHHCPSPKLLKPLADVICMDKSAKLRQHCAKYMLQVRLQTTHCLHTVYTHTDASCLVLFCLQSLICVRIACIAAGCSCQQVLSVVIRIDC